MFWKKLLTINFLFFLMLCLTGGTFSEAVGNLEKGEFGWIAVLGSEGEDYGDALMVDRSDYIYLLGEMPHNYSYYFDPKVDKNLSKFFLTKFTSQGEALWQKVGNGCVGDILDSFYFVIITRRSRPKKFELAKFESDGELYRLFSLPIIPKDIFVGDDEYIYMTGYFRGSVDFDPGSDLDLHSGDTAFLSKFDPAGNFLWAKSWAPEVESFFGEAGCAAISGDDSGNIYLTGWFDKIVDFDPGPGVETRASNGGPDIFLSKFNSDGEFQWVRTWGGENRFDDCEETGCAVAIDSFGNVYVAGEFRGNVDFDPGPEVYMRSGEGFFHYAGAIFLSKFDPAGNFLWAKSWEGESTYISCISIDSFNNIYISGRFSGNVDFDPGPGVKEYATQSFYEEYYGQDIYEEGDFLVKINAEGEFQWVRIWEEEYFGVSDVQVDSLGNIYLTGMFRGTVDLDPGVAIKEYTANDSDIFVIKLSAEGLL